VKVLGDIPPERSSHAAIAVGDTVYVWGGSYYSTDLYQLNVLGKLM
jgi:hypothetical protein